ncbi:MAG: hypothetical protein WCC84_17325 [Candidatus Cybelea sp.]
MARICGSCSFESADAATFCARCGTRLLELTAPEPSISEPKHNDAVSIEVLRKGFAEKYDGFRDALTFEIRFSNKTSKSIKAFKADIEVYDLFEKRIIALAFQVQEPLGVGVSKTETFYWEYNQFRDEHTRTRASDMEYLVFKPLVEAVIFQDGTKA